MFKLSIDRRLLRAALGLKDKLHRDLQARFLGVSVPLGLKYTTNAADLSGHTATWTINRGRWREMTYLVPESYMTAEVNVYPTPDKPYKSSRHRVFVVCPCCKREIPAGRWHQHTGTGSCVKKES